MGRNEITSEGNVSSYGIAAVSDSSPPRALTSLGWVTILYGMQCCALIVKVTIYRKPTQTLR